MSFFKDEFIKIAKEAISSKDLYNILSSELNSISNLWISTNKYPTFNLKDSNCESGSFMATVINELYYVCLKSAGNNYVMFKLVESSKYKELIYLYNKICYVINMDKQFLLFTPNTNDMARNELRNNFLYLTKDKFFWDKLEVELDLFFKNFDNMEEKQNHFNNINLILESAFQYSLINGQRYNNEYAFFINDTIKIK